jgi:hypothetical protein
MQLKIDLNYKNIKMKVKKTYYQLIVANILMDSYLKKQESENKLCAAIKIFSKDLKIVLDNYNDELDSLQISNCAIDPKTNVILKDEKGNKQFTIEGELNLKKEAKKLLYSEVEISSRILDVESLISTLNEDELEYFSGLIIPIVNF